MAKLTWNAAKLRNLKYCAESSTNAQAIVYFSPLLKNMSKHGHSAANINRCCKMIINMNSACRRYAGLEIKIIISALSISQGSLTPFFADKITVQGGPSIMSILTSPLITYFFVKFLN